MTQVSSNRKPIVLRPGEAWFLEHPPGNADG